MFQRSLWVTEGVTGLPQHGRARPAPWFPPQSGPAWQPHPCGSSCTNCFLKLADFFPRYQRGGGGLSQTHTCCAALRTAAPSLRPRARAGFRSFPRADACCCLRVPRALQTCRFHHLGNMLLASRVAPCWCRALLRALHRGGAEQCRWRGHRVLIAASLPSEHSEAEQAMGHTHTQ